MRVTNGMMVNNLMRNITKNYNRMDIYQQQMATGKKFSRPSDDPIGVSKSLRLNTEVATMEQYKRNADDVGSWLSTTEMAVKNINDVLERAKELTVQAATETNSINERKAIASEIKELRDQLVQIGNTTYAGSYIFSGFKTDKALFNSDGTYYIGGTGAKLVGDEIIEANVGMGDKMGMNSIGQRVFGLCDDITTDLDITTADSLKQKQSMKSEYIGPAAYPITDVITFTMALNNGIPQTISLPGPYADEAALLTGVNGALSGVFGTDVTASMVDHKLVLESDTGEFKIGAGATNLNLIGLRVSQASVSRVESDDKSQLIAIFDKLIDDLGADDTAGISSALSRIETQADNINAIRAEIGVKTNRIELTTNRILDDTLNLKELLSKNEDADMAEVIMNINMQENVYKASLSTGARIIQPSLIDFLR